VNNTLSLSHWHGSLDGTRVGSPSSGPPPANQLAEQAHASHQPINAPLCFSLSQQHPLQATCLHCPTPSTGSLPI